MGDDTGYPSAIYSGGSEDDFSELRRQLGAKDAEITRLSASSMFVVTTLLTNDAEIVGVGLFDNKEQAHKEVSRIIEDSEFKLYPDDTLQDAHKELEEDDGYEGADVRVAIYEIAVGTFA